MRQLLSTALVACIVGALAGASFGAVAQVPAEPPVSTTALNADTVDGLSAVKATNKKAKRRNRLVATDAKGFLPSNIIKAKWGLIAGKPAFLADGLVGWNEIAGIPAALADGQVGWGEVQGIPAALADGVDGGVTSIKITSWRGIGSVFTGTAFATGSATAKCQEGRLIAGGYEVEGDLQINVFASKPIGPDTWQVTAQVSTAATSVLYAFAICVTTDPGGAVIATKKSQYGTATPRMVKRPKVRK